jgi:phosphopantetheine adenylyltransferase
MFRWLRERRQRAHLAEVARVLEQENERLRDLLRAQAAREENAKILIRALRDVNADLDRQAREERP